MNKPKVGDVIYLLEWGHRVGAASKMHKASVVKVGRKYFEATADSGWPREVQFEIESRKQASDFRGFSVYNNPQEREEEKEHARLLRELRDYFFSYRAPELTLAKLREIAAIIKPPTQ